MGVLVQRVVYGLLMLTLALPACGWHVCRCAHLANSTSQLRSSSQSKASQRPCCAKRRVTAQAVSSPTSGYKARCCCDEIRWSQSVAKIVADRGSVAIFPAELAFADGLPTHQVRRVESALTLEVPVVRSGPGDSVLIVNCRWQV